MHWGESAAKIDGILNPVIGLIAGLFLACLGLVGLAGQLNVDAEAIGIVFVVLFGLGALPVIYRFMGTIGGAFLAVICNLADRHLGGLEVE